MANEDNKDIVAGLQNEPAEETKQSQYKDDAALHDWELIHCSSEGWDEPSVFKCSKCGALRVSSTFGTPAAEGCPVGAKPQSTDAIQSSAASGSGEKATLTANGQSSDPMAGKTPEERLAEWDALSVLLILERYERGQLITREEADAQVQTALADVLPMDAEGHLLKPGDRAHIARDNGTVGEFTVLAVGRSTVITDTGASYPAERCLRSS